MANPTDKRVPQELIQPVYMRGFDQFRIDRLHAPALYELPYIVDIDVKGCDYPWLETTWFDVMNRSGVYMASERYSGDVVGVLVPQYTVAPYAPKVARVQKIVVHKRHRRLGVGSQLMSRFLVDAINMGCVKAIGVAPEHYLDPRAEYDVSEFLSRWFRAVEYQRDVFNIDGKLMDGVLFETDFSKDLVMS